MTDADRVFGAEENESASGAIDSWPPVCRWIVGDPPFGPDLDAHLGQGWERIGPLFCRGPFGFLDGDAIAAVPVRQNLTRAGFSANQRKLVARNRRRFRLEVRRSVDPGTREALYAAHKPRFVGSAFPTLADFLDSRWDGEVDRRELAVYDDDRLVAVSYFLYGHRAVYSLLGLFDPDYARYSLGLYTMLEETEFLRARGGTHYYPGHVLVDCPVTDYKMRLRGLEFFDWRGSWVSREHWSPGLHPLSTLRQALEAVRSQLEREGIEHSIRAYPYFGIASLLHLEGQLFAQPLYIDCGPVPPDGESGRLAITFDLKSRQHDVVILRPDDDPDRAELLTDEAQQHGPILRTMRAWQKPVHAGVAVRLVRALRMVYTTE